MAHEHAVKKNLKWAMGLTASILLLEIAGGIISGSLALLADAGHVFMDVFAMFLSFTAITLAERPADEKRTFGWHRAEVFAAVINGSALLVIAGIILKEACQRILAPTDILPVHMMAVAAIGLVVNVVVARRLHGHDASDLNVKSAYLHVISDMLGSVIVVLGGIIIYFSGWRTIDPILSIGLAGLIIFGSFRILKESINVLLEGVPSHINLEELQEQMLEIEGVSHVHDLHVWSICSHIVNLACHLEIKEGNRDAHRRILGTVKHMLAHDFGITHTIIEVEENACSPDMVSQDLQHGNGHHHHYH